MKLLLLLAFALSAQDQPPQTCALSGTVVNSVTGEPLNKVEVRLEAIGQNQRAREVTTTDAEGRFTMVDIEPGNYHLSGKRNAYIETAYGARRASSDGTILSLEAGQALTDLKLKLVPSGVIAGAIRDSDGEPLGEIRVTVARIVYQDGKPRLDSYDVGETDDLGQYRIRYLSPGKYYVGARLSRENYRIDRSPGRWPREDIVPTVYPGSANPALAAPIEVRAGARLTGIDITMARVRTFALSGRITTMAGVVGGVSIALRPHSSTGGFDAFDLHTEARNPQGDFEFRGVPPGAWEITARNGDLVGQAVVQVGSVNVEGVRIALRSGAKVHVRVTAEGDARPDLAHTHAILDSEPRHSLMLGVNGSPTMFGERDPTVMPGRYQVKLMGVPKGYYVRTAATDQYGHFEMASVPPGDYKVFAWDDVEPGIWFDADFLRTYEKAGEAVTVRGKQTESVKVRIAVPE